MTPRPAARAHTLLGWASEVRTLRRLLPASGNRWLDLGCGPGYVAAELLASWPQIQLIGVDADIDLLSYARAETAHWSSRVTFAAGSAVACPLAGACIDLVFARYLFQHLADPLAVAQEAYRVLVPGGRIVVIDIDEDFWGIASPRMPSGVASDRATDPRAGRRVGRRLWKTLIAAGFEDVHLDAFVYHSDALGMPAFQEDPRASQDPDGYVLLAGLMASGARPTTTR